MIVSAALLMSVVAGCGPATGCDPPAAGGASTVTDYSLRICVALDGARAVRAGEVQCTRRERGVWTFGWLSKTRGSDVPAVGDVLESSDYDPSPPPGSRKRVEPPEEGGPFDRMWHAAERPRDGFGTETEDSGCG
jgi:hypothetical protein